MNDMEIEGMLAAGQKRASRRPASALRLPLEVAPMFREWLKAKSPTATSTSCR